MQISPRTCVWFWLVQLNVCSCFKCVVLNILLYGNGLYVQGFHLHLRKCIDAPCVSPEIADAVILEFMSQWNQNAEEKHMGAPHYGLASLQMLDECVVRDICLQQTKPLIRSYSRSPAK
jgi:hypothetical protein